jgi:hypothetical protein
MPYLVQVRGRKPIAVAALEEARVEVGKTLLAAAMNADNPLPHLTTGDIGESGGTVGLPDGTVIEVEPTGWDTLYAEYADSHSGGFVTHADVLAAYNARQS